MDIIEFSTIAKNEKTAYKYPKEQCWGKHVNFCICCRENGEVRLKNKN